VLRALGPVGRFHTRGVLPLALVALATGALLLVALPAASEAAFPGKNGRIAFATNEAANVFNFNVFSIRPDGTGLIPLTEDPAGGGNPEYSPDGKRIVFTRRRDGGGTDIWLMRADGSDQRLLGGSTFGLAAPSWSPNGTWIVFGYQSGTVTSDWDVAKARVVDSGLTDFDLLTGHPADDHSPSWSPKGTRIAFTSERTGNGEIFTMRPDGFGLRNLTKSPNSYDSSADWSPGGGLLAFESDRRGQFDIYTMRPDGSHVRRLTTSSAADIFAAWSPNGQKIAFQSFRDGDAEIFTMWRDGSHVRQLTHNTLLDLAPDWQPR
jgi:Tol biopolymer transport system component